MTPAFLLLAAAAGQLLDRPPPDPPEVGVWDIRPYMGRCSARLALADGTRLVVTRDRGRGNSSLDVRSPAWTDIASGERYRLAVRFHPGGGSLSARSMGRRSGAPGETQGELALDRSGSAVVRRMGAAAEIEILVDGRSRGRFAIPGAAAAMAELQGCAERRPRDGAPDGIAFYFSANDYPVAALVAREEGIVGFRLVIDADGRVAECLVSSPSGSAALDEKTCRILRERARYRPAAAADPATATQDGTVTWLLPR